MGKVDSFMNPPQKCGIVHHYNALNLQTLQGSGNQCRMWHFMEMRNKVAAVLNVSAAQLWNFIFTFLACAIC